ncbi:hypothetical protein ACIRL2_41415 [Embleya sp. NPDC127516]|uniref:hypothetical protein n=1 Tax=Embleya sp. NPDC127516 TaxID=3363990 RepID=UPI003801CD1D
MQLPVSVPPAGLGLGSVGALLTGAPTWAVLGLAFCAVASMIVPSIVSALSARGQDRRRLAERERHFAVLDVAAGALGAQERVDAMTEVLRILHAPEPAIPPSPSPLPAPPSSPPP